MHALNKGRKSQITYQPFLRALLLAYSLCSFFFSALYFVFAGHAEALWCTIRAVLYQNLKSF